MKRLIVAFVIIIAFHIPLYAQNLKPYTVVVKTKSSGKERGVLYNVTSNSLILDVNKSMLVIDRSEIKKIKIYASSVPYNYKKIFTYAPWDENNFETRPNELVRNRKWGQKDPEIKEEIGAHINTTLMNTVINLVTAPLSAIKGSIFKARINRDVQKFDQIKSELYYYSIHYQLHTDYKDELNKINMMIKRDVNLPNSSEK